MTIATTEPTGTTAAIRTDTQHMGFGEKVEYAKLLADAGMIPEAYRNKPANCLVAIEYGEALGVAPIVAINQIAVVKGGVSMEAKLMISLARKAGHTVRLSGDDKSATCVIIRADDPAHEATVTWDQAKATKAGLWGSGHWAKNPGLMLRYRAAAENIRLTCPEVLAGISHTPEEQAEIARRNLSKTTVTQVAPPAQPKTAGYYMKALKLTGASFKGFAERVLGKQVTSWERLDADDQDAVLGQLGVWEQTGTDPTLLEAVDGELVNPVTCEVEDGDQP